MGVEYLTVACTRLAFRQRGEGPPLVLLHGLPGDGRVWNRQLESLADEFRVVAWDAPGCGRSGDPSGRLGLTEVAKHLVEFLQALDLTQPDIAGLSWGGGVALELHRIAPEIPRRLVLASAYAGWAGSLPPAAVAQRLEAYLSASRTEPHAALVGWGPGMFSAGAPAELVDELVAICSDFHPGPMADLARSFATADLRDVLPTVRIPTLILHGDADVRSPLDVGRALHAAIDGSRLTVLEGVGHVSNIEAPERFDRALRDFLQSVDL